MMEYLDIYDEKGKYLGSEERGIVHQKGLWHNTVHCWLHDGEGNVFFQIRADEGTLYTTASGHLQAGETIEVGFKREIEEEIGISIDASDAILIDIVPWQMDKKLKDGSLFKDRAKAHVYLDLYEGNYQDFQFDEKEVSGLVLVSAKDALSMFEKGDDSIRGIFFENKDGKIVKFSKEVSCSDFLLNAHETLIKKYGDILRKVILLSSK